jgi:hypothetical protein
MLKHSKYCVKLVYSFYAKCLSGKCQSAKCLLAKCQSAECKSAKHLLAKRLFPFYLLTNCL